ncbi:hypothetical protein BG000_002501 [Podila horticola]|nr:hypothetical protein BG003_002221 [Podila horticola]KAG0025080.1 hypothetical protein BGZ82_010220 [Podila clonocystis]KAG0323750.1 hypothetical protein BG000_002501 [Podila horticola]
MGGYLTQDPAVEKWVRMRESTAKHFRWNARNVRTVGILGLVIPAGFLYLSVTYDRQFQWAAKGPSPKPAPVEDDE